MNKIEINSKIRKCQNAKWNLSFQGMQNPEILSVFLSRTYKEKKSSQKVKLKFEIFFTLDDSFSKTNHDGSSEFVKLLRGFFRDYENLKTSLSRF